MAKKPSSVEPTAWVGWVFFAAVMLMAVGGMQIIAGLVSILNNQFYAVTSASLVAFNYTAWGWIHLILGIVAMLAGFGILVGSAWARVVAVFLTVLVMIDNVAFMNAYPLWSIVSLVIGGFTLYALTMHGGELAD
jgi:hypothetical protein